MNIHIDRQRAIALLEKAVELRGEDFIYESVVKDELEDRGDLCAYEYEGLPSCGVGWALSLAGVRAEVLSGMDMLTDSTMTAYDNLDAEMESENPYSEALSSRAYLRQNGVVLTDGAAKVFQFFQTRQDILVPWGEALKEAKRHG